MITLPDRVKQFFNVFRASGYQIYAVGGAVRNLLLNRTVDNWDFATDAQPKQIQDLFPDAYYNNQYGTVTVAIEKVLFEVTPFRKEGDYQDARHPQKIQWTKTIEDDLSRRDFTINAIAYDGREISDPYGGQKDLADKIIRAVGDPNQRFGEDALRLMRAIRFATELGFLIENATRQAIIANARKITRIAGERVRDELMKIIASDNPADGILFLHNTKLLQYILPELEICFMIPQKSPLRHHIYDVGTHSVMALKNCPSPDPVTRLATLLHDIGKAKTFRKDQKTGLITFYNHEVAGTRLAEKIASRLRLSNKDKSKLVRLVKYHQFTVSEIITDKAIRRFIRELGKEYIQDMLDLRTGDRVGSGAKSTSWRFELFKKRLIEVQKEPFKITDLKINGNDVMQILHLKSGPQVGQILASIFSQVIEGKIKNKRADLIKLIKRHRPLQLIN